MGGNTGRKMRVDSSSSAANLQGAGQRGTLGLDVAQSPVLEADRTAAHYCI